MTIPSITDHALLRWMERVHGIDVKAWRALMREELCAALDDGGSRTSSGPAFIVYADGQAVVTYLGAGQEVSLWGNGIAIARVEAEPCDASPPRDYEHVRRVA